MLRRFEVEDDDDVLGEEQGPYEIPTFRLTGFPQTARSHSLIFQDLYESYQLCTAFRAKGDVTLKIWGDHLIPPPRINQHTLLLMQKESPVQEDSLVPNDNLQNTTSLIRDRLWHLLERKILKGNWDIKELNKHRLQVSPDYMCETYQIMKLLKYQLVMRTVARVNVRCVIFCKEVPAALRLGSSEPNGGLCNTICGYLGQTASPKWENASYKEILSARQPGAKQWSKACKLSVTDNNAIVKGNNNGFWDMPWSLKASQWVLEEQDTSTLSRATNSTISPSTTSSSGSTTTKRKHISSTTTK